SGGADGSFPAGYPVLSGGTLYGSTFNGVVFSLTTATGDDNEPSGLVIGSTNTESLDVFSGSLTVTNGVLGVGNNGTLTGGTGHGAITVQNATLTAASVLLGSTVGGAGDLFIK